MERKDLKSRPSGGCSGNGAVLCDVLTRFLIPTHTKRELGCGRWVPEGLHSGGVSVGREAVQGGDLGHTALHFAAN